jgi:hypothetical protein
MVTGVLLSRVEAASLVPSLLAAQLGSQAHMGSRQHWPGIDLHRWRALPGAPRSRPPWLLLLPRPHADRRLMLRLLCAAAAARRHLRCLLLGRCMVVQQPHCAVQALRGSSSCCPRCPRCLPLLVLRELDKRHLEAAAISACRSGSLPADRMLLLRCCEQRGIFISSRAPQHAPPHAPPPSGRQVQAGALTSAVAAAGRRRRLCHS